ncbi:pyridoxal phosphate phosphatase PHOSPHO2 [Aplysia californica]|uniref:Pyridoxal phosphate phosphatase PHOSPHO2 n=1 Tax=Aplysia californica TaxID=6500 RepID=A0ABM0JYY7_APLCA|nr:pyridoxal phosphate phosphatase PHOSPHO2 [Aplysia californica]XP_005104824.1 pyridoxal phosphate phosphatase PHOSPHO2 [Aplysia californica]
MAEENERSVVAQKVLMVFDFDHTLVDENSDLYVRKLAPNGELPEEISSLYQDDGWTNYMGEIFKYLHRNGSTPENILNCMSEISLTEGIQELLHFTRKSTSFEHIIISDSNSVFIDHILKKNQLSSLFRTFTNPARFEDNGCLIIEQYHTQDWCPLSTVNLCKGHILNEFISERQQHGVTYHHVIYVGDGFNDLCPGLALRPQDFLMPRVGFKLHKVIEKMAEKNKPVPRSKLEASVVPWSSGLDILQHLRNLPFVKTGQSS